MMEDQIIVGLSEREVDITHMALRLLWIAVSNHYGLPNEFELEFPYRPASLDILAVADKFEEAGV